MSGQRRETFVPTTPDMDRIDTAGRLYNAAVAWADANDLEEVMFR